MKINDKRLRSDSITAQGEMLRGALEGELQPPANVRLRDCDLPFWRQIIAARARETWNESDLCIAGALARCRADMERIQRELDEEGDTLVNARGTVVMNPKHSILETLTRRSVALARVTHVHAEATVGNARDTGKRTKASKQMEKVAQELEDDDLIATPH